MRRHIYSLGNRTEYTVGTCWVPNTVPDSLDIVIYLKPSANKAISSSRQRNKLKLWWSKEHAPGYAASRNKKVDPKAHVRSALLHFLSLWVRAWNYLLFEV